MARIIIILLLVVPLSGLVAVLLAHRHARARILLILGSALICLMLAVALAFYRPGLTLYTVGGWRAPYGIELRVDALTRTMILLTAITFAAAALYETGRELAQKEKPGKLTYHITFPLLLFSLNGLFLANDFFNFYVFFESAAVSSYLLVAMGRNASLEAAWKYAAQSIIGSASLISAVAFLYGVTGSLNMTDVSQRLAEPVVWIMPFVLIAFLIKGALFPFHFWQPDAYAAASTAGKVILAGALTNVGIYGLFRFWPLLFADEMRWLLLWLGTASVLFGAVAAWREQDAERMLGFSSTSQLGFVLVALGWSTQSAVAGAVLFTFHHGLSKALLFLSIGILADHAHSSRFSHLAGSGNRTFLLKTPVLLGFLSLVGLPPAIGFLAKFSILNAGIRIASWPWVAVVALGTVLTLLYAARAYQILFWNEPHPNAAESPINIHILGYAAIGFLFLLVVGAGLYGQPFWQISEQAAENSMSLQAGRSLEAP